MTMKPALIVPLVFGLCWLGAFGARQTLGRDRPDIAAFFSFDDCTLWTFTQNYRDGKVGPFQIGQQRNSVVAVLSNQSLLDQDKDQLKGQATSWRVTLPAKSKGYVTYKITFEGDRVDGVQPYYSMFADL